MPGFQGYCMSADSIPEGSQPAALLALLQDHISAVFAVCLVYTRNPDEAEDLVQETLLKATASIGSLRDPQAMRLWLLQIARRRCMNYVSRKKSMEPLPAEVQAPVEASDIDVERLELALSDLPKDYQETIRLHYLKEMSCASIGEALNISVGAVRVRLTRGRWMLHERLKGSQA
jgi:RNA polymerase sigma-70 factor (ECF subfamily)